MTLIAVYNSEGCVGRCDARCYDATSPDCDCICGGKNHGAGVKTATANTQQMAEQWIDKYTKTNGPAKEWKVPAKYPTGKTTNQLALPMVV